MTGIARALHVFGHDDQGQERPDWAAHVIAALSDALTFGHGKGELTDEEKALITGILYRVRGRLGETTRHHAPLDKLGNYMIHDVMKKIDTEIVAQVMRDSAAPDGQ